MLSTNRWGWPRFLWDHCFFPPGSWYAWELVCTFQEWSFCFRKSCGIPAIKARWASKLGSLGASTPVAILEAGDAVPALRTFASVGTLLWYILQFVGHWPCGHGIWFYKQLRQSTVVSWLLLCFWMEASFGGGFQHFYVDCYSWVVILVFL